MKKYLIQILVVLLLLTAAWGLFLLGKGEESENKPIKATVSSSRLPTNKEFFPIRNWSVKEPEITANSAIVMNFKINDGQGSVLYKKNMDQVLPIASLTKIMSGIIVLENFDLQEIIKISKDSVLTIGDNGGLIRGEELEIKDLLSIMLIESSNDAAIALAKDNSQLSYDKFIDLMNNKAKELGLENTHFVDPTGLDSANQSTVYELSKLANYALKFPMLWDILKLQKTTIYSIDNKFVHNLINTNKLLNKVSFLKGGKTGYTEEAGECMLTVSEISTPLKDNNYLITVVLGSNQREIDTETLITWTQKAYLW